ncbi:MAG: L-seryl-tRNA(Sec) selenium transferase [Myxococcota bacterium]|nr:L-seryl-tRNA(Sec) selenium transferase [Myxococcota bacterium]
MLFSSLPSISTLLQSPVLSDLQHTFAVRIARDVVAEARKSIQNGENISPDWDRALLEKRQELKQPKLRRVINATGVVVHTNLGRAPLPTEVLNQLTTVMGGYSNLEFELSSGKRGGRLRGIAEKICYLTNAEDAIVVNNNAAATMLAVSAIASGARVVVSRGELVEIGGSFRIPEVIETGGAILKEVGTTNRTRASDYAAAVTADTNAFLRVHSSNFRIVGFTERPSRSELARVARDKDVVLIEDLGSGLLANAPKIPQSKRLEEEESIRKALKDGVDVLTFSGDKLLGGVQAGFIVGKKKWVQACRRHPLYRALRLGKLNLAALELTLQMYIEGRAHDLPVWQSLEHSAAHCQREAEQIRQALGDGSVESANSYSGGGALPEQAIPTYIYKLNVSRPNQIAKMMRLADPPIVVRIQDDSICIDPRTLLHGERDLVIACLRRVLGH